MGHDQKPPAVLAFDSDLTVKLPLTLQALKKKSDLERHNYIKGKQHGKRKLVCTLKTELK